jgi:hypothetical protein
MTGYRASLQDNDSYAFRVYPPLTTSQRIHQEIVPAMSEPSITGVRRCQVCGELLNKWDEPLTGLVVRTRRYDVSLTYDGIVVVSPIFRSVYSDSSLHGLTFRALPDDPEFEALQCDQVVEFDGARRKTRFVKQCSTCGRFESVVGATPVFLRPGCVIGESQFVRTDLEFGSGDEKHPLLLCGSLAADVLRKSKLKGLELIPF